MITSIDVVARSAEVDNLRAVCSPTWRLIERA
jgi:hypothetical protein